ncbi:adenylyl-sulfate kinase [Prosthecochloris sp. N3]|uniref:Adenylyl-sulfate kinase n=1 Tax=Prosthecochloris ethylica TaxID=2743976 RepID=A0ABR9XTT8_9CHLB|nr:nucleoside-triphosphatase [Prosthecochloris ethylica]MBF0587209.1 adenylyl-sulfate kinase [Prosthecochloris ethylica]MBF0637282.1 adenylyl-sulfate kinase [Prosthecochloris ethylica]NUK48371.1 adenylyl-sulfate kinase [Prosthecochloris ethylica]
MLGDILLIGDQHRCAAAEISRHAQGFRNALLEEDPSCRYTIAISGESGAGKSELSHALARELKRSGLRVKVLHTDNYYRVEPMLRREHRERTGFRVVGPGEYDWEQLNRNIRDFREARQAVMPCIDILTDEVDQLSTDFSSIDVLVVDGLYAIGIDDLDLRIFIDLTYHETKKSQLLRGKESTDSHRWQVLEREHQGVRSLMHRADLVVDSSYAVSDAADYMPKERSAVAVEYAFA